MLVSYTHHRVKKMEDDLNFFKLAQQEPFHFRVTKLFSEMMKPMFEVDEGSEEIRATVHFCVMDRNK